LICGHRLSLLLLFLKWPACSVFLRQVSASSGDTPAKVRQASSHCSVLFFNVLLLLLGTAGMSCVFPASVEAPTKFCIFRRVSGDAPAKFPVAVFRRILLVNYVKNFVVCCW
jgi:hypothetical protein